MASLVQVVGPSSALFREVWAIYESSFPPDERRSMDAQLPLFSDERYSLKAAVDGGRAVGFISSWALEGFTFIEHIAVHEGSRGRGSGTAIMLEHLAPGGKAVLEVEPPTDERRRRRISFYERLGFLLNPQPYLQPPYGPGKKAVSLLLMSRPEPLDGAGFAAVRAELHVKVYKLAGPMV